VAVSGTGRLARAYFAALVPGGTPRESPGEGLDELLAQLVARGKVAHPEVVMPNEAFVAHLAGCGAPVDPGAPPESMWAEDLYLACAAVLGDERAIARLMSTHEVGIASSLRKIDPSPTFAADVGQRFWDAALVGTVSAPPRLAGYSGRGPLAGWIGVSVQRLALMSLRHEQAEGRARRAVTAEAEAVLQDPELVMLKQRYREPFRVATEKALEALDDRERLIFRLHLVDGVTVERIGQTYGVSHSTVSRWFAKAREKVVAEIQRALRDELAISEEEFESLKRLVLSQMDLSLTMLPAPRA
jgi:RNA polymerase sigma-70 factor (ECF subfamily)